MTVEYDVVVSAVPLIEVGGEDGAGNAVLAVEVVGKIVAVVVGLYYYVVYRRSGYLYPALDVELVARSSSQFGFIGVFTSGVTSISSV